PWMTEMVLTVSRYPMFCLVLPAAIFLSGLVFLKFRYSYSEYHRCLWASTIYNIPLVGTLIRSARLSAFTDLLAILVDHEVPLTDAFRLAGDASSDPVMAASAKQIHHELTSGHTLGEVLDG